MELRHYASLLWRWIWLISLGTLLAAAASLVVSQSMPKVYEASTTLLVNQAQNPGAVGYNDVLTSERLTRTYGELIRKRPVLENALEALGASYTPARLAEMVSVRVVRDTMLLELKVESTDAQESADLANAVAGAFIDENRQAQLGRAALSRDALKEQLQTLEISIRDTSASLDQLRVLPDGRTPEARQAEIARLQNTLSQYQITYSQLLKSEQDMRLAETRAFSSVVVAEPAIVPPTPIRPKTVQNVLLAALVGLVLAVGVVLLLEYLDDTVKSGDEVSKLLGAPALGYVLRLKPREAEALGLVSRMSPRSPVVEAFRVLRSNLQFSLMDRPGGAILITSAGPGAGKTTTAVNLAQVIAQTGKRTILVDADLRRPSVHRHFGLKNERGLTTALLDPSSLDDGVMRPSGVENLSVITAGPLPPNPSELLGSSRMSALVEALKARAEIVLFDSPPALVVTDPSVLAGAMDGVLVVVDTTATRSGAVLRTREALERAAGSGKVLGGVLNKLTPKSAGYYYYYYYYHRYGYGPADGNGNGSAPSMLPKGEEAGRSG